MIFLKLTDGLGNQMFQFAFALALKKNNNERIYLDVSKLGKFHVRSYGLDNFVLNERVIIPGKIVQWSVRFYMKLLRLFLNRVLRVSLHNQNGFNTYARLGFYTTEEPIKYFDVLSTNYPVKFVRGFYQSGRYFSNIKEEIRKNFILKNIPVKESILNIQDKILNCNSVCLHIRRGDYLKYPRFQICTEKYYQQAISYFKEKIADPVFFIFSNSHNDIEWIKRNYRLSATIVWVDLQNKEEEDFYLMQCCKHFIISNSTFSWWAAYLSVNEDKKVIAPYPWIRGEEYQDDIYEESWIKINVDKNEDKICDKKMFE